MIGDNVRVNAKKNWPLRLNACRGCTIKIGDNCLFSNDIELHTTDYHKICDQEGSVINHSEDITIGDHCWIGLGCIILKGVSLPNDVIVGAKSVVTRNEYKSYSIIAGNPSKTISENKKWNF